MGSYNVDSYTSGVSNSYRSVISGKIIIMRVKQIPGYPDYEINENGDVFSNKFGKVKKLRPVKSNNGYYVVNLCTNKKCKLKLIHRLVLMAFASMPKKGEEARHFPDRDTSNNHISNLEWGTHKENCYDRDRIHKTGPKNESNGRCKLSDKEVLEIIELYKTGKPTRLFLANKYKVSITHIGRIVNYKRRAFNIEVLI